MTSQHVAVEGSVCSTAKSGKADDVRDAFVRFYQFAVLRTIRREPECGRSAAQLPVAAVAIVENHSVGDYLDSADTVEEALERAKVVR